MSLLLRSRSWIAPVPLNHSHPAIRQHDICSVSSVRCVAAMLDLDPDKYADGHPLPRGWHFFLLGGATRRSALRADGFPGFGVPMPDFGLPRLLIGGRTVDYRQDIPIGARVLRTSKVDNVKHKETAAGPMAIVTLRHDLQIGADDQIAISETQTYILLSDKSAQDGGARATDLKPAEYSKIVTTDDTLLFQYSALGFNSHKIHIDRMYSQQVEGLPDLIVNGGLTTLLLMEFLRNDLGQKPRAIKAKYSAPLFCGRPITLNADCVDTTWQLKALDEIGVVAASIVVEVS